MPDTSKTVRAPKNATTGGICVLDITINKLNTVMMVIHAGRVNPKMMIFSIMLFG